MDDRFKQHGAVGWTELMTTDSNAAKEFYAKLFGWSYETFPMEGVTYHVVNVAGQPVGGIMDMPLESQGKPPHWGSYVTVSDVDATATLAEELGGKILITPTDIPDVGRFCLIQDPQGATISFITYVDQPEQDG